MPFRGLLKCAFSSTSYAGTFYSQPDFLFWTQTNQSESPTQHLMRRHYVLVLLLEEKLTVVSTLQISAAWKNKKIFFRKLFRQALCVKLGEIFFLLLVNGVSN